MAVSAPYAEPLAMRFLLHSLSLPQPLDGNVRLVTLLGVYCDGSSGGSNGGDVVCNDDLVGLVRGAYEALGARLPSETFSFVGPYFAAASGRAVKFTSVSQNMLDQSDLLAAIDNVILQQFRPPNASTADASAERHMESAWHANPQCAAHMVMLPQIASGSPCCGSALLQQLASSCTGISQITALLQALVSSRDALVSSALIAPMMAPFDNLLLLGHFAAGVCLKWPQMATLASGFLVPCAHPIG